MIKGIYNASRNMYAKENNMEIAANNVANINTTGFKRELPFSEIMARYEGTPVKQITDTSQGNLIQTANPLDLSISSGNSYFVVDTPEGFQLTRNGRFRINEEGVLVNEQGYSIMGKKGEVIFPQNSAEKDQTIIVTKSGEVRSGSISLDDLQIVKVENPALLLRKDATNFSAADEAYFPANPEEYEIQQGYLEEANVNPVLELQAMIDISKEFEASQKVMNALDHSLEQANQIGRV